MFFHTDSLLKQFRVMAFRLVRLSVGGGLPDAPSGLARTICHSEAKPKNLGEAEESLRSFAFAALHAQDDTSESLEFTVMSSPGANVMI